MFKVEIDPKELQTLISEAIDKAIKQHNIKNSLPPLLTRTQLKELLGIKDTKVSELLNREDFPVIREFGHPRVPTHLLFVWIDEHTDWIKENAHLKVAI